MMRLLTAELRKLLTVRSTYAILGISLAITLFMSFYVMGIRMAGGLGDARLFSGTAIIIVNNLVIFTALVCALLVTHEYRYNTILYTLASSNSRLKVLLAKLLAVSLYATLATLLMAAAALVGLKLGLSIKDASYVTQDFPVLDLLWRTAFYGWAFGVLAALLAFIIRSQVGTIVALIFLPGPGEALLGLLLKQNAKYLPFSALTSVLQPAGLPHGKAALVVLAYIAIGSVIAAVLFQKRDAN